MQCKETPDRIFIKRGEKTILQYNKTPTEEAARHESYYTRSGYIHPLYSPSGEIITGDYAADHKHQHGLFFAWTKTSFEGRKPEFWNQKIEAGKVTYLETKKISSGDKECSFTVMHLFEDLTSEDKKPKPVLHETWTVTAIDRGDEYYEFSIETVQECASDSPLTIEKYHYGGMAIRGNDQWLEKGTTGQPLGVIETSGQHDRMEGNHTRPDYVMMHGPVGEGYAGVLIAQDKENFRYPQWVRLHPSKPYFVFSPMVEEPFQIKPGNPYKSRYRYVVFDGEPNAAMTEEILGSSAPQN